MLREVAALEGDGPEVGLGRVGWRGGEEHHGEHRRVGEEDSLLLILVARRGADDADGGVHDESAVEAVDAGGQDKGGVLRGQDSCLEPLGGVRRVDEPLQARRRVALAVPRAVRGGRRKS